MATKNTAAKTTTNKAPVNKTAARPAPAKKASVKKAAAKPAPAKKASVKKAAARPAPAKKASVKKAAAKPAPAKKAPAKKASVKKPAPAKKTAANKTPVKKASVKKALAKKAPAKKAPVETAVATKAPATSSAARRPKLNPDPFGVGDKVVYPHHGAATIVRREKLEFKGEKQDFYVLEIATDQLIVRVPAASAMERGVRPVISKSKSRQVFQTLRGEPQEAGSNWSRWYKVLTEKINSGDIFQVAEVIRDLDYAQKIKGISPALKRMLAKARLIIISELQFSLNISEEEATKRLERALPKVEIPEED